eukprot:1065677-Pyramimonas_sp.AAC.1
MQAAHTAWCVVSPPSTTCHAAPAEDGCDRGWGRQTAAGSLSTGPRADLLGLVDTVAPWSQYPRAMLSLPLIAGGRSQEPQRL